jgi:hypothetical protein
MEKHNYHIVGTAQKSNRKTYNAVRKQYTNLIKKQKYHIVGKMKYHNKAKA